MLGILCHILRDTFYKFNCKQCKFKSMFAIAMAYHLYKEHKIRLTKKDWKFLVRYSLLTRLIKSAFALPLFIILFALKMICIPFHYLYEIL
jgi:hypothetical protein